MIVLLLVGFLGGLVTGISPCILPVLPVIFASGAASGIDERATAAEGDREVQIAAPVGRVPVTAGGGVASSGPGAPPGGAPVESVAEVAGPVADARARLVANRRRRRPFAVVGGLVLSFSLATLLGTWLLSALGLPYGLLRWIGIVALGLLGTGLLVPEVGDLLERPFARITAGSEVREGGGFVLGLSLGLVFVPCAGPVLATITAVGGTHHVGWSAVLLTVAFAIGVAIPLLAFAIAGQFLGTRMRSVRTHAAN